MRKSTILMLALTLALAPACADDQDTPDSPPITLPRLYEYHAGYCRGDCRTLTLYRHGAEVELRAYERDGGFIGVATATLTGDTNDELSDWIEALSSGAQSLGELPKGVPTDGPIIQLYLPYLTLNYAEHHPPSGLIELDTALAEILDDLSQCRATIRLHPDFGCVALAYYPE
jgi:hypothetical protein